MKIKGRAVSKPNKEIIVLPRGDDDQIVLEAQAVLDYKPFEKMYPMPVAPEIVYANGKRGKNFESKSFKEAVSKYGDVRTACMILKSLEPSEIEWDTVDMEKPDTWLNYEADFHAAGFSDTEVMRIINGIMNANCLNDAKIDEARKRFLTSQQAPAAGLSPQTGEQPNTASGESANASA